jgi:hypothetical protein
VGHLQSPIAALWHKCNKILCPLDDDAKCAVGSGGLAVGWAAQKVMYTFTALDHKQQQQFVQPYSSPFICRRSSLPSLHQQPDH